MSVNPENSDSLISGSESTPESDDHPSISSVETNCDTVLSKSNFVTLHSSETSCLVPESERKNVDLTFESKGLHLCNLNIRHQVPKLDELRLALAAVNGPDIFGVCETFLDCNVPDCQLSIQGFDVMRKDRSDTQNKSGGGLVLYYRNSLNCKRRAELEISNIETLWSEFTLPQTRSFLVCTVYRPPNALSEWIDLFEN